MGNLNHHSLSQSVLTCRMKTSMIINRMPTVIKAFAEARIGIQNYLHELETCTGKKATGCPTRRSSALQCSEYKNTWLDQPSKHPPSHAAHVQSAPEHHGITLPWQQQPPPLWDPHQSHVPLISSFHWAMSTPGHSASRETHKCVVIKHIDKMTEWNKLLSPGKANCRKRWT